MLGLSFTWPWNPWGMIVLLLLSVLCLFGVRHVRAQPAQSTQDTNLSMRQIVCFFAGILTAAFLLLTPVDTIARTQLFSVHMVQAILLITLCSPLILAGCPAVWLRPLLNQPIVRSVLRALLHPIMASVLFNATFLLWHAP